MVTGLEIASGIYTLASILKRAILLADSLRGISVHSNNLSQQLTTLSGVLDYTHEEFKRTLKIITDSGTDPIGFDVTTTLLDKCISDCTVVCMQYETLLGKIASSRIKAIQWKRAQNEFSRLHTMLEARKSTLLTLMTTIREIADKHRHAHLVSIATKPVFGFASRDPYTAPPPYTAQDNQSMTTATKAGIGGTLGGIVAAGAGYGAFVGGPFGAAIGAASGAVISTGLGIATFFTYSRSPAVSQTSKSSTN